MANTTTTPNMGMILPVPGVEVNPTWATELITAFTANLDAHDHTTGKGVKIPTSALLINNDLPLNHFNLLTVNSVSLDNQLTSPPLSLSNPNHLLLAYNDDLWYQKTGSVAIRITSGSSLNIGAVATNVFAEVSISTSGTIAPTDTYTYVAVNTTGGVVNINLPAANAVTAGRYYIIKDAGGQANINAINVIPAGTDQIDNVATTRSITLNYGSFFIVSNGTNGWNIFRDGHLAATSTGLGVVQLGGDLSGPGSTATAPKVVIATPYVPGLMQLAGDLDGTYTAPRVQTLASTASVGVIGALDFVSGSSANLGAGSVLNLAAGSSATSSGATTYSSATQSGTVSMSGTQTYSSGAVIDVLAGASETVEGSLTMESGSTLTVSAGTTVAATINLGTTEYQAGSTFQIDSGATTSMAIGNAGGVALDVAGALAINTASSMSYGSQSVRYVLGTYYSRLSTTTTSSSFTYADIGSGFEIVIANCSPGDVMVITASVVSACSSSSSLSGYQITCFDGGTGFSVGTQYFPGEIRTQVSSVANSHQVLPFGFTYTVVNAGTWKMRIQIAGGTSGAAATATAYGDSSAGVGSCSMMVVHTRL